MSTVQQQITELEQRRSAIYAGAAGRRITDTEILQLRVIARALTAAWELPTIREQRAAGACLCRSLPNL